MDSQSTTSFERCALASGLLTQEQLDEGWAALRASSDWPPDPDVSIDDQLAGRLVELGWLNFWQSTQLLEGRTKFNLGAYWMIDSIGRGGMGQVFKAEHSTSKRVVAVKVLPRSKCTPEAVANFVRETQTLASLDHENLVQALAAGEDGNVHYLVTEYVPGSDLRKLVRREGVLSMDVAARIISQVAAALEHAHQRGLVHRDVKPGNVLVAPDGHAKLSDLGLAGPLGGDTESDPRFGKIVGTADYLSPDHIREPRKPTPAWDIYSLGCTLYYAVTGKVPFPGGSVADKVRAHCELRPLDPRRLNASMSAEFVEVVAEMMTKDPAERIQAAAEVIQRLKPWTDEAVSIQEGSGEPAAGPLCFGKSRTGSAQGQAAEDLKDTASSFPEIPELLPGQKENSQASQTTDPVTSDQETSPAVATMGRMPGQSSLFFHPLAVLVLFPVSIVGLIMLLWWLFNAPG